MHGVQFAWFAVNYEIRLRQDNHNTASLCTIPRMTVAVSCPAVLKPPPALPIAHWLLACVCEKSTNPSPLFRARLNMTSWVGTSTERNSRTPSPIALTGCWPVYICRCMELDGRARRVAFPTPCAASAFNLLRLTTVDRAVEERYKWTMYCTNEIWKISSPWDTMKRSEPHSGMKCDCLILKRLHYESESRKISLGSIRTSY